MKSFFKTGMNLFYTTSTCKFYYVQIKNYLGSKLVLFFLIGFFFNINQVIAQNNSDDNNVSIVIDHIFAEGNKQTKLHYLLRELDFKSGDTILLKNLQNSFEKSRNSLINTNLYNQVSIDTIGCENTHCNVKILLEERWRIFPIPQIEVASQNYNVWINEQNADLKRLTYGGFLNVYNLRGVGESFEGYLMFGYRNLIQATYKFPYLDKQKKFGLSAKFIYRTDKQIAADSRANKLTFYPDSISTFLSDPLARRWIGNLALKRRVGINENHFLKLRFHTMKIDQSIADFNPNYFNNGALQQSYFAMSYTYERDYRDFQNYPLTGYYLRAGIGKYGLGVFKDLNTFQAVFDYSIYKKIAPKTYLAGNLKAYKSFGSEQPYFNNSQIGFSFSFIRGYEYYIVTTQQYLFLRTNLRYQIIDWSFQNPLRRGDNNEGQVSVDVYFRAFAESANVKDRFFAETNPLNNEWLFGSGIALDFIFWENIPMSIEYTINRKKERGFFVHLGLLWDFWVKT